MKNAHHAKRQKKRSENHYEFERRAKEIKRKFERNGNKY